MRNSSFIFVAQILFLGMCEAKNLDQLVKYDVVPGFSNQAQISIVNSLNLDNVQPKVGDKIKMSLIPLPIVKPSKIINISLVLKSLGSLPDSPLGSLLNFSINSKLETGQYYISVGNENFSDLILDVNEKFNDSSPENTVGTKFYAFNTSNLYLNNSVVSQEYVRGKVLTLSKVSHELRTFELEDNNKPVFLTERINNNSSVIAPIKYDSDLDNKVASLINKNVWLYGGRRVKCSLEDGNTKTIRLSYNTPLIFKGAFRVQSPQWTGVQSYNYNDNNTGNIISLTPIVITMQITQTNIDQKCGKLDIILPNIETIDRTISTNAPPKLANPYPNIIEGLDKDTLRWILGYPNAMVGTASEINESNTWKYITGTAYFKNNILIKFDAKP